MNSYELAINKENAISVDFEDKDAGTADKVRATTTTKTGAIFNAINGISIPVKDCIGKEYAITDIVCTSATVAKEFSDRENKDAVKADKTVVHFFTDNGEHIATLSNGIKRAVENMLGCGIIPTPEIPIRLKFTEGKTKNGKCHSFDIID